MYPRFSRKLSGEKRIGSCKEVTGVKLSLGGEGKGSGRGETGEVVKPDGRRNENAGRVSPVEDYGQK